MSKILADPDTVSPSGRNIGGKIRGSLPVLKVFVDRIVEGFQAFSQCRSPVKVTLCPLDRFSADLDHLGWLQVVEDERQDAGQDLARFLNGQIQTLAGKGTRNGVVPLPRCGLSIGYACMGATEMPLRFRNSLDNRKFGLPARSLFDVPGPFGLRDLAV